MRLIAILIAIFGGSLIWYGAGVPHSMGIQYMALGGAFLFGGLFLYAYMGKRKK